MSNSRTTRAQSAPSLEDFATWELRPNRTDAIELIEEQSAARVPELVPLRYERMSASPFAFFRGSAIIMARDLAGQPATGIEVQCIGDAHIANFGIFASPTRHLVFDVNDFDETAPGPWEWDVKRLAARWQKGYDWRTHERALNSELPMYTRDIDVTDFGALSIHYVHKRSSVADAIPLLFVHGCELTYYRVLPSG